jgi:hypothetical protein
MNFTEAVQALNDGRCEGIKKEGWLPDNYLVVDGDGCFLTFPNGTYIPFVCDFLADDWQLVNERPQMEEVEVVRWECDSCGATYVDVPPPAICDILGCNNNTYIKLTGKRLVPVKPKVKRREKLCDGNSSNFLTLSGFSKIISLSDGKDVEVFIEWGRGGNQMKVILSARFPEDLANSIKRHLRKWETVADFLILAADNEIVRRVPMTSAFARTTDPSTSKAAAASVDTERLYEAVTAAIRTFGENGCTIDELLAAMPGYNYNAVSPRIAPLERKGLVVRNGDTRRGVSGRQQLVIRSCQ